MKRYKDAWASRLALEVYYLLLLSLLVILGFAEASCIPKIKVGIIATVTNGIRSCKYCKFSPISNN